MLVQSANSCGKFLSHAPRLLDHWFLQTFLNLKPCDMNSLHRVGFQEWRRNLRVLETAFHLVAECSYSKQVWTFVSAWATCPLSPTNWTANQDLQAWFTQLTIDSNQQMKGLQTLVLLVIWSLWMERNKRIFQQEELTTNVFISLLRDNVRTWIFAGAKHLDSLVGHIFQE